MEYVALRSLDVDGKRYRIGSTVPVGRLSERTRRTLVEQRKIAPNKDAAKTPDRRKA